MKRKLLLVLTVMLVVGMTSLTTLAQPKEEGSAELISPLVSLEYEEKVMEMTVASLSAEIVTPTVASVTATVTPKKVVAKKKPSPTPTAVASEEVNRFVDRFAGQYGVDPNVIRHIALCESGFRSNATNHIYGGLFQFDETTWRNIRKQMGEESNPELRFSAEEAVQTAAWVVSKGKSKIWPNCVP